LTFPGKFTVLEIFGTHPIKIILSKKLVERKNYRNESHVKKDKGSSNSESNHLQIVTSGKTSLRAETFSKAKDQRLKRPQQKRASPINTNEKRPNRFHPKKSRLARAKILLSTRESA